MLFKEDKPEKYEYVWKFAYTMYTLDEVDFGII